MCVLLPQDCIDPQAIQLVPSKALVSVGDTLPVLATVTDTNKAPMSEVTVTFTTTFQRQVPSASGEIGGYGDRYGGPRAPVAPPVATTSTAVTNALGQVLLLTPSTNGQPGQFTIQATAPTCTGQLVTSNTATITVLTAGDGGQHPNYHHGQEWHYRRYSDSYKPV
jgi:hypothetical protein